MCPYLWLDPTFPKVRASVRVVPTALMMAIEGATDREAVLGLQETTADWKEFLNGLLQRRRNG